MAEDTEHNGFRISTRRWIPFEWRPRDRQACTPEIFSAHNQLNEKHLKTLLDRETRDALPPELVSLEALVIEVLYNVKQLPPAHTVILGAGTIEWFDDRPTTRLVAGDFGIATLCLDMELPYEVNFFAVIEQIRMDGGKRRVTAKPEARSDKVVEMYQQLLFIYHRRERRQQKLAFSGEGEK